MVIESQYYVCNRMCVRMSAWLCCVNFLKLAATPELPGPAKLGMDPCTNAKNRILILTFKSLIGKCHYIFIGTHQGQVLINFWLELVILGFRE